MGGGSLLLWKTKTSLGTKCMLMSVNWMLSWIFQSELENYWKGDFPQLDFYSRCNGVVQTMLWRFHFFVLSYLTHNKLWRPDCRHASAEVVGWVQLGRVWDHVNCKVPTLPPPLKLPDGLVLFRVPRIFCVKGTDALVFSECSFGLAINMSWVYYVNQF